MTYSRELRGTLNFVECHFITADNVCTGWQKRAEAKPSTEPALVPNICVTTCFCLTVQFRVWPITAPFLQDGQAWSQFDLGLGWIGRAMLLLSSGDNLATPRMYAEPTPAKAPCKGTILGLLYQTVDEFHSARKRFGTTYCSERYALRRNTVRLYRSFMVVSGFNHGRSMPSIIVSCLY
jgi:hypothetical protein